MLKQTFSTFAAAAVALVAAEVGAQTGDVQLTQTDQGGYVMEDGATGQTFNMNVDTSGAPAAPPVRLTPNEDGSYTVTPPPGADSAAGVPSGRITGIDFGREGGNNEWTDAVDVYTGIIPGERDALPHLNRTRSRGETGSVNTLSWIGFQPLEGTTRVFLQTGRAANYDVDSGPDGLTITVTLDNTRVDLSNFRRNIDASYFDRAVSEIEAFRGDNGSTEVVIQLSRAATYTVESAGEYLYLDFAE